MVRINVKYYATYSTQFWEGVAPQAVRDRHPGISEDCASSSIVFYISLALNIQWHSVRLLTNQQMEVNIELVVLQSTSGIFTQSLVKNLHYYCNLKVIIANDPESPGLCLLHTNADDTILWCCPSEKGEATAVREIQSIGHYSCVARFEIKGKREILARRYPCVYRDTSGRESEHGGTSQDVSWTPGQHQGPAQPRVPRFGQQGRWGFGSFGSRMAASGCPQGSASRDSLRGT